MRCLGLWRFFVVSTQLCAISYRSRVRPPQMLRMLSPLQALPLRMLPQRLRPQAPPTLPPSFVRYMEHAVMFEALFSQRASRMPHKDVRLPRRPVPSGQCACARPSTRWVMQRLAKCPSFVLSCTLTSQRLRSRRWMHSRRRQARCTSKLTMRAHVYRVCDRSASRISLAVLPHPTGRYLPCCCTSVGSSPSWRRLRTSPRTSGYLRCGLMRCSHY